MTGFTITGTVVDASGQSIPEASVWFSQDRRARKTSADAGGRFRFEDVAAVRAEIVAMKDGYAVGGLDAYPVGPSDVKIVLGTPDVLHLRVIDATHQPVAGARIKSMTVNDAFHVSVIDLVESGFSSDRSEDNGKLEVVALPRGGHVGFVLSHPNYAETEIPYLPVGGKEQSIVLYPGVVLRGRITNPANEGVAQARVSVYQLGAAGQKERAEVLTDHEGFYRAVVRPGEFHVAVRHPKFAPPLPKPVVLAPETEEGNLDLTLLTPHLILGSVIGPDGKPVGAVRLMYLVEGNVCETVLTRVDGRFRICVPAGKGILRVIPPDGFVTEKLPDIEVTLDKEETATLSPVQLKLLPEVSGKVVNSEKEPQARVLISSVDYEPAVWAITDDSGEFRVRLPRVPRTSELSFHAEHALRFLRKDFMFDVNHAKPVSVTLQPFEPDLATRPPQEPANDLAELVNQPAPEIACDTWWNSEPLTLAALRGKVIVLAMWGGFDTRSEGRDRLEELRALFELYRGVEGVAFLSVHDGGKDPAEIAQYLKDYRLGFPVGRDQEPFVTFQRYRITYIPQIILIDKKGALRFYDVGGRLLELIKSLRREQ
ncbi:MAG: carboxypeptidase regulatory-like domain-containing protein [Candidatus Hydrogenedentes bacterium]|nr:carboxypeptidase regulatory-like domain-containing protein [Candidatus Hydrogenedentota bacterium]